MTQTPEPKDTDVIEFQMVHTDTGVVNCSGTMPYSAFKSIANVVTSEGYKPQMIGVSQRPKRIDEPGGMVTFG